ncbi:hypothetical protein IFM89_003558 [Coptis chinensis]|uniref:Uncharacterized protein n=1 Tax=Coptis chinensis TaxID=261450 RepID=A0A835GTX8_9MAGN|nr:hypothetical protein IFM89_003558 [Coptis chinensis]
MANQTPLPPFELANETPVQWTLVQETYFTDQMGERVNARGDHRSACVFSEGRMGEMKRFICTQGCPEYKILGIIFGDTIATGHLQVSQDHDFNSSSDDEDDDCNDDLTRSVPATQVPSTGPMVGTSTHSTRTGEQDKNDGDPRHKCPKLPIPINVPHNQSSKASELSSAVKLMATDSQTRNELLKSTPLKIAWSF